MIWIIVFLLWILIKLKLTQRKYMIQAAYKNKLKEEKETEK